MDFGKLRTLGPKEATLVLGLIENGEDSITRQKVAARTNSTLGTSDQILRRLVSKGWLVRAGKGVYIVQPADIGCRPMPDGEAYSLLSASEPEAVVAYGTAAALWGLTTQLRHEVTVVSPKRARSREMGPVKLRLIHRPGGMPANDVHEKTVRGNLVRLSGIERTAVDCLSHPGFCGGFDEVEDIVAAASRKWDWEKLKDVLTRNGVVSLKQRLGYLLDKRGVKQPAWFREWLLANIPSVSRAYLVPKSKGRLDSVWHVIA